MKKMFSALLMAGVLATGAAACSSDDDDDDTPTEETTSGTAGGDGESQSEEVEEYCAAAEAFADEVEDDGITPDLSSEGQDLVARGAEAAVACSDDAERIGECTDLVTEALSNV